MLFRSGWFIGPATILRILPHNLKFREKILNALMVFPRDWRRVVNISFVSVLFHITQILLHAFIAVQLGATIPVSLLFTAIPIVNILSSLPISWNGLGVRENAYIFFLVPSVLSHEQAVAMGVIWLSGITISASIGGIVAIITNAKAAASQQTAAEKS